MKRGIHFLIIQNVKFIYKGKIYTNGDILLSTLENPPFGIMLQSMITAKIGGKKTKHKKHKVNVNKKTKKTKKRNRNI